MIFRAIIEESDTEIAKKMQELSIYEGTFLKHLHQSLFEVSKDIRVKVNRQISRELLTLWISANPKAEEVINKIFVIFILRKSLPGCNEQKSVTKV